MWRRGTTLYSTAPSRILIVYVVVCVLLGNYSTPQVLWAAYDKYADPGQWCKLDQIRLISLDFMFRRYLAFHRNHLSFKVSNTSGYVEWLPSVTNGHEVLAFSTQTFGKDKPFESAKDTTFANLQQDLQKIVEDKVEFRWIHIADLRCLDKVAEAFGLHKFAKLFFMDLRSVWGQWPFVLTLLDAMM